MPGTKVISLTTAYSLALRTSMATLESLGAQCQPQALSKAHQVPAIGLCTYKRSNDSPGWEEKPVATVTSNATPRTVEPRGTRSVNGHLAKGCQGSWTSNNCASWKDRKRYGARNRTGEASTAPLDADTLEPVALGATPPVQVSTPAESFVSRVPERSLMSTATATVMPPLRSITARNTMLTLPVDPRTRLFSSTSIALAASVAPT